MHVTKQAPQMTQNDRMSVGRARNVGQRLVRHHVVTATDHILIAMPMHLSPLPCVLVAMTNPSSCPRTIIDNPHISENPTS